MSETANASAEKIPNVYFIDDSATMREVIKIAFRHESINVIACHDAASALERFNETAPDAVITDVIMPGKDGYEVCHFIKNDVNLAKIPVILMSGVVDRGVAEKAIAAKADELIRKPFQPQELIARVKNLLSPRASLASADQETAKKDMIPTASLSGIFAAPAVTTSLPRPAMPSASLADVPAASFTPPRASGNSAELQKLRFEIQRLEMLVKKLQSELEAERQYAASLESHMRTLQETE